MIVNESKYMEIKEWLDYCDNQTFLAKKTGVSPMTISRVKRTKSFDDYKKLIKEDCGSAYKKEEPKTMIVSYDQFMNLAKDVDAIKESVALLVAISTDLLDIWKGEKL